jgi:uncharacterized protein YfaA (DUF2138 family)
MDDMQFYENLANAIVLSAKDDYIQAVMILRRRFGKSKTLDALKAAAAEDKEKRKKALEKVNKKRAKQKKDPLKLKNTLVDKAIIELEEIDSFIGSPWYHFLTNLDESVFRAHLRQIGG